METTGIYQVVHSDLVFPYLDTGFSALDWRANPQPELRELAVHAHVGRTGLYRKHRLTGAISPKFYAKTHLHSLDVRRWIEANPGYDIYLISGYPFIPYLAYNSVERGRLIYQSDFEAVMRDLCGCLGIELPDRLWRQTNANSAYASYWFAGQAFWETWTDVIETMLSPQRLGAKLYGRIHALSQYHAPTAPPVYLAPFLYESLISIYITMKKVRALYYAWDNDAILGLNIKPEVACHLRREMPVIDAIDARNDWTAQNRAYLLDGYLKLTSKVEGPEFDASDRDNFNLPRVRPPLGV